MVNGIEIRMSNNCVEFSFQFFRRIFQSLKFRRKASFTIMIFLRYLCSNGSMKDVWTFGLLLYRNSKEVTQGYKWLNRTLSTSHVEPDFLRD